MLDESRVAVTIYWQTGETQTVIMTPEAVDGLVHALFQPDQVVYACDTFADTSPQAARQHTSFRLKLITSLQLEPGPHPPRLP